MVKVFGMAKEKGYFWNKSISWLPIIIMICFLSGLIIGLLIGFL
nr:MAG TPA: Protein of unknown function (DUF1043) [Caudoviricetes sp.]